MKSEESGSISNKTESREEEGEEEGEEEEEAEEEDEEEDEEEVQEDINSGSEQDPKDSIISQSVDQVMSEIFDKMEASGGPSKMETE